MKIVQIITKGCEFYGAQKHVFDLSLQCKEHGHDVTVICGSSGSLTQYLEDAGIPCQVVPSLRNPINLVQDYLAYRKILEALQAIEPDVVATHSSKAGILGRLAARRLSIPVVFTAHGWSFADGLPLLRRKIALASERFCARFSNKIIVVAESERTFGLSNKVADESKLITICYGIQDQAGEYTNRSPENDSIKLVMVAGFRNQKDHTTLLRALVQLQHLPWTMTFLGDGYLEPGIKQLVLELDLESRVFFAGAVTDVPRYLRESDLMVLTTNWEGMPICTLEGLSFSLPIIATDVAGVSETVKDGKNGYLVVRGGVHSVKEKLEVLITDGKKRIEYGRASRKLFEKSCTLNQMYGSTIELYEEAVGEEA